jgi:hypothetical protein
MQPFEAQAIWQFLEEEADLDQLALRLAAILPRFLAGQNAEKYFDLWQAHGFHLTPVHFYQPVPDTRQLPESLWERDSELPGIDMREAAQLALLRDGLSHFGDECRQLPLEPTGQPHEFYLQNDAFSRIDAYVLYAMVRHFRPSLVLEVGSGFSSRLTAQAALRNGNTRLICIEPYPNPLLQAGFPGLTALIARPVQDIGLDMFASLQANDILFIDSSHVVRCGGDVNYLYLQVLPRLNPGVIVHIHDIFLPREQPRVWVKERHWFWTEQYLLQAFLLFNSDFEVLFANAYIGLKHGAALMETFGPHAVEGGSFWMCRRSDSTSEVNRLVEENEDLRRRLYALQSTKAVKLAEKYWSVSQRLRTGGRKAKP